MAYVLPNWDETRRRYMEDPANGPRVTPPSFVSSEGGVASNAPPPVSSAGSGGRFAALRGFLSANQDTAEAQALPVAQGIESTAQEAVTKADESARLPENYGGLKAAQAAQTAKDDAQSKIGAALSDSSSSVFDRPPDARYSEGERAADSALFGRTNAFQSLSKWQPVLSALSPTYQPGIYDPVTPQNPGMPNESRGRDNWGWARSPIWSRRFGDSMRDLGDSVGDVARGIGDAAGDVGRALDPSGWF